MEVLIDKIIYIRLSINAHEPFRAYLTGYHERIGQDIRKETHLPLCRS